MFFLLRQHGAQRRGRIGLAQHRKLAFVNAFGAIFAGLIDPDDFGKQSLLVRIAR